MRLRHHNLMPVVLLLAMCFIFVNKAPAQRYRVLVVVTPASYRNIGSAQLRTRINNVIANANLCYAKSHTPVRVELAGIFRINYVESKNGIAADYDSLHALQSCEYNTQTKVTTCSPIWTARSYYSADVVSMVDSNSDYSITKGGTAGIGCIDAEFYWDAVSVVNWDAMSLYPVMVHEIGHNFGCEHDTTHLADTLEMSWPETYAHGYIPPSGKWGSGCLIRQVQFIKISFQIPTHPMGRTKRNHV